MNSYQKLKLKISQQDKEIKKLREAITDDNFMYLSEVKLLVKLQRETESLFWLGESRFKTMKYGDITIEYTPMPL